MYYDRLVDETDMQWLFQLIKTMVKVHFRDDFLSVFKHLAGSTGLGKVVGDDMRSLLFGDYMKPGEVCHYQFACNTCMVHVHICNSYTY